MNLQCFIRFYRTNGTSFPHFSEYTSLNIPFSIICDWEIARCTEYCMKKNVNISFPEPYSRSAPYNDVLIIAALVIDIKRFQLRHPPELEYRRTAFMLSMGVTDYVHYSISGFHLSSVSLKFSRSRRPFRWRRMRFRASRKKSLSVPQDGT